MTQFSVLSPQSSDEERLRRWRLILGGGEAEGTGCALSGSDLGMDQALGALYDGASGGQGGLGTPGAVAKKDQRRVGMGPSSPTVARWLGDIRSYFPASVVRVMQQDALERLNLRQMLLEPEMLEAVVPDVHLVAT